MSLNTKDLLHEWYTINNKFGFHLMITQYKIINLICTLILYGLFFIQHIAKVLLLVMIVIHVINSIRTDNINIMLI